MTRCLMTLPIVAAIVNCLVIALNDAFMLHFNDILNNLKLTTILHKSTLIPKGDYLIIHFFMTPS